LFWICFSISSEVSDRCNWDNIWWRFCQWQWKCHQYCIRNEERNWRRWVVSSSFSRFPSFSLQIL